MRYPENHSTPNRAWEISVFLAVMVLALLSGLQQRRATRSHYNSTNPEQMQHENAQRSPASIPSETGAKSAILDLGCIDALGLTDASNRSFGVQSTFKVRGRFCGETRLVESQFEISYQEIGRPLPIFLQFRSRTFTSETVSLIRSQGTLAFSWVDPQGLKREFVIRVSEEIR